MWPSRNDEASTTNTSVAGSSMASTSGDLGVAAGHRTTAGGLEHLGHHRRDGGLAVGAGDGHDRAVVPGVGEVELGQDRAPAWSRAAAKTGWRSGTPGLGHDRVDAVEGGVERRVGRRLQQVHGLGSCRSHGRLGGMVVDDDDLDPPRPQRTGHGPTGDAEADHEHAAQDEGTVEHRPGHQSIVPGSRTKSA